MNTRNMLSSAALVLVGFCAAVGLNFLSIGTTVHGAASDAAQPPLKAVAHDATLAGDGTTALPLGIANGAVTAPKLSTAAVPSIGQVLGFNGANLAWQDAPVSGARVVDSRGQLVGPLIYVNVVLRKIGDVLVRLGVGKKGYLDNGNQTFYHTTADCSGQRYYIDDDLQTWRNSFNTGTYLVYAADPLQPVAVNSLEYAPTDPSQSGSCIKNANAGTQSLGIATTVSLSTIGLAPPFHVEF